jgi:sec-independent protein translocase protein TatC
MSQIGLALPTLLLYEISIIASRWVEKQRAKQRAESEEGGSSESTAAPEIEDKLAPEEAKTGE